MVRDLADIFQVLGDARDQPPVFWLSKNRNDNFCRWLKILRRISVSIEMPRTCPQ